ncbi:MAG: DUF4132 domain-containing protein, partial [Myxococcales bacterium]|nr:DUF4132 domain-containing protein [Myxococcales bacterium]
GSTYQLQLRCVTDAGAAPVIYATLAHLGRQATDTLVACLHVSAGAEDTRLIADALARIGTTEALEALMAHAHHKDVVGALAEATQRFPTLALSVLARTAARARSADQATTILRGLIRREGEALRPAIAALDDAERRLCEKLLADATPKVEATEDELPAVLRRPRWEGARKAGPPQLKGLAPERLPSAVRWPAGRREEWSAFVTPTSWDEAARSLGLPSELRPFIVDGKEEKFSAAVQGYKRAGSYLWGNTLLGLPPAQLERLLRLGDLGRWYVNERDLLGLAALRELEALDFLLAWVGYRPAQTLAALLPFGDVRIAPHAAAGLGKKTVRADAEAWLRAHPRHAAAGLLPLAFDKAGKARDAAMAALRFVASGDRGALDDASRALGAKAAEGIEAILDFDELDVLPTKMPKLPSFFVADAFERPVLKSGKALPSSAVETLGLMLALSKEVSEPYAGVGLVKDACTPESLAAFGWELFQAWTVAGSPGKEGWAFAQLGWLGDDECARRLTPLIRAWPGESAHARAVLGLDVLAGIGTDVALMHLNGIAEKLKFKGLQEKAREKIAALAEARGLSPLELADRLVPDLGLDEDGSLVLDFGPRQFRVGFDEGLKPFVKDEEDKLVRELPKPKKTDDAEKAQAATNAWKALKKDARAIASQQVARLELAMVDTRRWDAASFETFLVRHPLVSHLVKRLVWGVYEVTPSEGEPPSGGELRAVFRVAEDGTYADVNDEPFALAEDAMVGVAHPLEIPAGAAAAMAQVLADYAIVQPFAQLGRETYRLTSAELAGKELRRVEGRKVSSGKVLGLETRGWRRGAPQDGGGIWWMERLLPGQAITAVLELDPGMVVGDLGMFPEQTLKTVYLSRTGYEWRRERLSELREIPAIAASELLRDLESLH